MAAIAKALGDPDPPPARRRSAEARRQGLRVRARAAVRPLPAHRLATTSRCCVRRASSTPSGEGLWAYYYVIPDALKELPDMADLTDHELREPVRERYAAAARGWPTATPRRAAAAAARRPCRAEVADGRRPMRLRRRPLRGHGHRGRATRRRWPPRSVAACPLPWPTSTRARRCSTSARAPAPTCSSAPAASARRDGDRPGHDRRDARARPGATPPRPASTNVEFRQGLHRGDPAARRERRRRHLELRHQPRRRQAHACSARPHASCARVGASPSPMSSPIPTWTTATRADMEQWTGCIAGALTGEEYDPR